MHGVFLAGLRLEAGDLAGAAAVTADLTGVPGMHTAVPALEFHLACRRGDLARARTLLPAVIEVVQSTGGRSGEFLHDLVSAALAAPMRAADVNTLIEGLDGASVEAAYRRLVAGQFAEAFEGAGPAGDPAVALEHFVAAAESGGLPPAARGTAHVGAARCLLALHRLDEARTHALAAADLLDDWSGWRVEQLDAVRSRLGLRAAALSAEIGPAALTPREREVALLIADGLTNADLAKRLYISPRTAAVHVSSILRKLEVASRTEVASALRS
jgi:DNA-binding CsgD family transcriptional regulator